MRKVRAVDEMNETELQAELVSLLGDSGIGQQVPSDVVESTSDQGLCFFAF